VVTSASRSARRALAALVAGLLAACAAEPAGFDAPACAIHDAAADVYLVSNVHGTPSAKDGNGYVARVDPDGGMERHWIQGGRDGVTLHAPKGMALAGDVLWVADIDVLRAFDRRTGAPLREIAIPGATSLADVSVDAQGVVYSSDRGLDAGSGPSGTDAIWRVGTDGVPVVFARGAGLGHPGGIVARDGDVYAVSWSDGAFYQIDRRGQRLDLAKAPTAKLDGLVRVPASEPGASPAWYATSWAGACVYRFDVTGGVERLPHACEQPAGLGFDATRRRLLVPLSGRNRLDVLPL
jgi:streptogramin lyase